MKEFLNKVLSNKHLDEMKSLLLLMNAQSTITDQPKIPTVSTTRIIKQSLCFAGLVLGLLNGVHADDSSYVTTESGLKYLDLKEGTGSIALPGDTVR